MNTRSSLSYRAPAALVIVLIAGTVMADVNSAGPNGVSATGLGLNGSGVVIGQVEPGRPGRATVDGAANTNALVPVSQVYSNSGAAIADFFIDNHAMGVAGTMISQGGLTGGIAQGATLVSGSLRRGDSDATDFTNSGRFINANSTIQNVIDRGAVIINHSWGTVPVGYSTQPPANAGILNGNSQLTMMIDWSSNRYGTLHVIAGNEQGNAVFSTIPTDTFNGLVVGATEAGPDGRFTRFSNYNVVTALPTDGRRTIHLVAPGTGTTLADLGTGNTYTADGTSFAAPHVSAVAALMYQRATNMGGFNAAATNPYVMRAILMNSADKVSGILGMDRTILRSAGTLNQNGTADPGANTNNWLQQRAAEGGDLTRNAIPLDTQLGTGAINASRALTQLNAGIQDPTNIVGGQAVTQLGWSAYSIPLGVDRDYVLAQPMAANDWISVTLTWERDVTLTNITGAAAHFDGEYYTDLNNNQLYTAGTDVLHDTNGNGTYQPDTYDFFNPMTLVDLDIQIVNSLGQVILTSNSRIYSVEHIFAQVPANDTYTIRVVNIDGSAVNPTFYGLAWWASAVPTPGTATVLVLGGLIASRRRRSVA